MHPPLTELRWIDLPPLPRDLLASNVGRRVIIPLRVNRERRAWNEAYRAARRIAAAREEWPWPTWEGR
jgi:hypothetical protein